MRTKDNKILCDWCYTELKNSYTEDCNFVSSDVHEIDLICDICFERYYNAL